MARLRGRFGLRAQLIAALVLTGAVTLAVAALTILSPLEKRLRRDSGTTLVVAADSARTAYADILREQPSRDERATLRRLNDSLGRRTGAEASLVSAAGRVLISSDVDSPATLPDAARALRRGRTTRSVQGDDLVVAAPLQVDEKGYAIVLRKRLTEVRAATRVVRRSALTAGAVGLAVALLLGAILSTALLRRLRRLRRAVLLARTAGPQVEPPRDRGRDEIGELARAFGAMQADVYRQEEARRAFVATASHELRTPVASLQVGLELLAEELAAPNPDVEDARAQVQSAHRQASRLGGLATDLLDLSRLDAQVDLRGEPVEMGELARDVVAEFALRAGAQSTPIEVHREGPAWATGDPGAIARILRILVDNALRFARGSAPITVSIGTQTDAWVAITVSDRGPGVPATERELIFERFRRGVSTGDAGGFGLGLAIGRELARRMGGDLELAPDTGTGAAFVVRLPRGDNTIPT